jgi:acyl dehydratase
MTAEVRPDQALLYRLSGDRNPLHSDPAFARRAGFDQPLLHGMCTFGIASRLLINELCGGDAALAAEMSGRFSKPVIPGERLTVKTWTIGRDTRYVVANPAGEIVLDRGRFVTPVQVDFLAIDVPVGAVAERPARADAIAGCLDGRLIPPPAPVGVVLMVVQHSEDHIYRGRRQRPRLHR